MAHNVNVRELIEKCGNFTNGDIMTLMHADDLETFKRDGYLLKKGLFKDGFCDDLFTAFLAIFRHRYPIAKERNYDGWKDPNLHSDLLKFREQDRPGFGLMYDTINLSRVLHQIFENKELGEVVGQLLDTPPETLCNSGEMLRIDTPQDKRNALDWHQDSSYYPQNDSGSNGLVVWVPILPVNENNGGLHFSIGSHKEGRIDTKMDLEGDNYSEQWRVPEELRAKYKEARLVAEPGDAAFIDMNIFHRSGFNSSDLIRLIVGVRFHKMLADDFRVGHFDYRVVD